MCFSYVSNLLLQPSALSWTYTLRSVAMDYNLLLTCTNTTTTMTGMDLDSIQQTWNTLTTSLGTKGSQKPRFLDVSSFTNTSFYPPYDPTPPRMTFLVKSFFLDDNLHDKDLTLPSTMTILPSIWPYSTQNDPSG